MESAIAPMLGFAMADDGFAGQMSPLIIWQHMGTISRLTLFVMVSMSIASMYVIADRFIAILLARRQSKAMIGGFIDLVRGGRLKEALEAARANRSSHVAHVMKVGLQVYAHRRKTHPDLDATPSVEKAMDRASMQEAERLRRGTNLLATVGSTAPFVGLFGTVVGIIGAFHSISSSQGAGLPVVIGGIAEALVATAIGICVAIPAVWGYNGITARTSKLSLEMDSASAELLDILSSWDGPERNPPDGGLPARRGDDPGDEPRPSVRRTARAPRTAAAAAC